MVGDRPSVQLGVRDRRQAIERVEPISRDMPKRIGIDSFVRERVVRRADAVKARQVRVD